MELRQMEWCREIGDLIIAAWRMSSFSSQRGCLTFGLNLLLLMPTVLRDGPYSFVFFSSDRAEPAHIHVKRDRQIAKFWLKPIELATNRRFAQHELHQIERLVRQHQQTLIEAWHDHFGA